MRIQIKVDLTAREGGLDVGEGRRRGGGGGVDRTVPVPRADTSGQKRTEGHAIIQFVKP